MKFIADFHIHSRYSIATSKQLVPQYLDYWAKIKGITVVGTGDFTHPTWVAELQKQLEPAEEGLFKLGKNFRNKDLDTPFLGDREVRFMLTAEISNIYKRDGKVRKVHNVIFAPDFETVDRIQQKLTAIGGNITSDGRPILGLDSRDLLEMALEASENIFFLPAHIWTPWFSALGSKSGFDTIEQCYRDLSHHIHAVETGLSTDPPMNWMCSFLDNYTLLSNSDAHSPEKLGRNANLFNTKLSYKAITEAIKSGNPDHFGGTIDLFPQEGKYHYDGHRKCGVCWNPVETLEHGSICSGCGKPVTVGVMNRVVQLSDREDLSMRKNRLPFQSIIPLKEILSELEGVGPNSKKVGRAYMALIKQSIPELELLLETPLQQVETMGGADLAESLRRMRNREIHIKEGFDGQFGVIKVFAENETPGGKNQSSLFAATPEVRTSVAVPQRRKLLNFDLQRYRHLEATAQYLLEKTATLQAEEKNGDSSAYGLNPTQSASVNHFTGPALVIAGPGTGKTRVLTIRVLDLIRNRGIDPRHILAVTFTNKAAAEIGERLTDLLETGVQPRVTTFHALGYRIINEQYGNFSILDPADQQRVIRKVSGCDKNRAKNFAKAISHAKQQLKAPYEVEDQELAEIYQSYENFLKEKNLHDLEDLLFIPVRLLESQLEILETYRSRFQWVLIDEYQDINLAQYRLIRALMPHKESNLCVIGDPDQAIYGFRGADVAYIHQFRQDYPTAAMYRLKQSYRCSDSILKASGDIMNRDQGETDHTLLKGMEKGVRLKIVKNKTHKSEAEFIARTIEQMMGGLRFFSMDSNITQGNKEKEIESLSDFVVLCRVKSQLEALEKAFLDHSIPFQTVGEEPFFKQQPAATLIDLLKLARNPKNEILKEKLLDASILSVTSPAPSSVEDGEVAVSHLLGNYASQYLDKTIDRRAVKRLKDLALEFGNRVDDFLRHTELGTAADTYSPGLESVALMTLHASKGLEFKAVFIAGCEEGLLPYALFSNHESDREEERRLLYVGMTRAKKFLFLCHAEQRYLRGRQYQLPRSSFIDGIEKKLIENARQEYRKKESEPSAQRSLFPE